MIASARKYWKYILPAILCAVVLIASFALTDSPLKLGRKTYQYEVADSQAERERGLSGRTSLAQDHAMLFEFKEIGRHCMWMKDMQFAIDIVWLSPEHHVLHIEENVSPETYPKSFCSAIADASYVIELPAGQVKANGLKLRDTAEFCLRSCYN